MSGVSVERDPYTFSFGLQLYIQRQRFSLGQHLSRYYTFDFVAAHCHGQWRHLGIVSHEPQPPQRKNTPGFVTVTTPKPRFWFTLGTMLLSLGLGGMLYFKWPGIAQATLPIYGHISNVTLIEKNGKPFQTAQLRRHIWVADFIFTTCKTECPLMNLEMAKIQQAFQQEPTLKLISFTVDPETDTPTRLKTYAQKFKSIPNKWYFLTGVRQTLHQLAQQDFKLLVNPVAIPESGPHSHSTHLGTAPPDEPEGESTFAPPVSQPFLHSPTFVLVDHHMQIRGYYDSRIEADITRLILVDIPYLLINSSGEP